jgi:DNA-3-methyladenine glycosylase
VANPGDRLGRSFFARPTVTAAQALLGCILVTRFGGETSGRIVEAEAYLGPDDPASHAARLERGRAVMSGEPGTAYVYRSYGVHAMLNVVTEPPGCHGAVLIRALEPLTGLDRMAERRGTGDARLLCSGPGRLCQALGISLACDGLDLTHSDEIAFLAGLPPAEISVGGRIGISRGTEHPWRFFATGSRFVSAHRRGVPLPPGGSMEPKTASEGRETGRE